MCARPKFNVQHAVLSDDGLLAQPDAGRRLRAGTPKLSRGKPLLTALPTPLVSGEGIWGARWPLPWGSSERRAAASQGSYRAPKLSLGKPLLTGTPYPPEVVTDSAVAAAVLS